MPVHLRDPSSLGFKDEACGVLARHSSRNYEGFAQGQCKKIIKTLRTAGVLYHAEYDDPVKCDIRAGLRVNYVRRPS
jgi:hypothetical protein